MKLQSATIKKFRRFKDLKIQNLPADARLIVLLGPNGCGKSALFDAFQKYLKGGRFYSVDQPERRTYYRRATPDTIMENNEEISLDFHGINPLTQDNGDTLKKSLYVRSAYRHDARYSQGATIAQPQNVLDRNEVQLLIDRDETVQDNYQRVIWRLLRQVTTPGKRTDDIMEATIGDLRRSMESVFGNIGLDALVSSEEIGTFIFSKGESKVLPYINLSAGEKAAFDLLLDIVINRAAFDDSLYCIDEPEIHLSTRVQYRLLGELYRLIPENSQLWLATHSIGMVRAVRDMWAEHDAQIVFLDMGFDDHGQERDYDQPQIIEPSVPSYQFWQRHYAVALDDLSELLAPERIVLCEGATERDQAALDEACYSKIFAREFPETRFVSVGDASTVEKRMKDLVPLLGKIIAGTQIIRFRDRDSSTPEEIEARRTQAIPTRTLSQFRNIESMLLSDGVLKKLCEHESKPECFDAIKAARDRIMEENQGNHAPDDYKPSAQAVHHAATEKLGLERSGETKEAFMRDILAPLVTQDMPEYETLKKDIFGE